MNIKAAIKRRVIEQVQRGVSLAEASFNARQWAKKAAAKERLKAKKLDEEQQDIEVVEEVIETTQDIEPVKEASHDKKKKNRSRSPKRSATPARTKR